MNPVRPYSIKSRSSKIADISNKSWYYTYVLWSEKMLNSIQGQLLISDRDLKNTHKV